MPISREELEHGRIDLTFPILRILSSRPDLGFSPAEVQQLLKEVEGREVAIAEIEDALDTMVRQARLKMRELGGQRWYTIVERRLGFRTE